MAAEDWKEKIESKIDALEEENRKLRRKTNELELENKRLRKNKSTHSKETKKGNDDISRRSFIKKLGAGAIGLGALSLSPAASTIRVTDSDVLRDGSPAFLDLSGSYSMNSDLDLGDNTINSVDAITGNGTELYINTNGGTITAFDNTNGQRILQAKEGGDVETPNGILYNQGQRVATRNWTTNNYQQTGTSSQGNVTTSGSTLIDDIEVDSDGHITNMNTQNRSVDSWNKASGGNIGYLRVDRTNSLDGNNSIEAAGSQWLGLDSGTSGSGVLLGYYNAPEVRIGNGNCTIELHASSRVDASGSDTFKLPHRSSDPSAQPGDMWYRTDLD